MASYFDLLRQKLLTGLQDPSQGLGKMFADAGNLLAQAATEKHPERLKILGLMFATGVMVEIDPVRAVQFFQRSANLGEVEAAYYLGIAYGEGFGVTVNPRESFAWLRSAASHHNAAALCRLGDCYRNGTGCHQDLKQARLLYESAANQGQSDALMALLELAVEDNADQTTLLKLLIKASDAGHPRARLALGRHYLDRGQTEKGLDLLERGAADGSTECMAALAGWAKDHGDMVQAIVYAYMAGLKGHYICQKWLDQWRNEVDSDTLLTAVELASGASVQDTIERLRERHSDSVSR